MNETRNFRDLIVWQKAMQLCEEVYALLSHFPVEERFGLCDQLRRAVVSVPSNIAEGNGRDTKKDYAHFLSTARGSLHEVSTQLELAVRLHYIPAQPELDSNISEIGKMLSTLISRLKQSTPTPQSPVPNPSSPVPNPSSPVPNPSSLLPTP